MRPDLMIKGTVLPWGRVAFSVWVHVRGIKMQTVAADLTAGDGRVPLRPPAVGVGVGGSRDSCAHREDTQPWLLVFPGCSQLSWGSSDVRTLPFCGNVPSIGR